MASAGTSASEDAETGAISPTQPQAHRDAPLPERRFRYAKILNVPMGESRSWLAQGSAANYRYASVFTSPAALLDDLFEHPYILRHADLV